MNNWIDISLAIIIVVSVVAGLRSGFVRSAVGFCASILGLILGLHYFRAVAVSLRPHIEKPGLANIIGFALIFLGVTVLGAVVAGMLARFIRSLDLVWLDRLLGAGFGLVQGLLYGAILIWGMMAFLPVPPKAVIGESRLAPCVMDVARRVADASPDEVKRAFRQSYRDLNRILPENIKDKLATAPSGQI
ncbi:MAG: CvpA family protein [Bryobacteraceae bacterium]